MPRKAEPVNVILMKGKSHHLTKAEIAERLAAEAAVWPKDDNIHCPSWLDKEGRKEWRRIVSELQALDLMTNVDIASLAIYCDLVSRYISNSKDINERGLILHVERPTVNAEGETVMTMQEVVNPSVGQSQKYAQLIKTYLGEFGLSPSARVKLRPPEKKPEEETAAQRMWGRV